MRNKMSPIINADELLALYQKGNLVIIDCSNEKDAQFNYNERHLDGALFVDLNTQLADIKENLSNGGRHPLPSFEQFSETLSSLGITPENHIIIYDHKNAANAAARFWWMLKSIGHDKVQILNGGFQAAEKLGFPINNKIKNIIKSKHYKINKWGLPLSDIFEVEKASKDQNYIIIDVRENKRYTGEIESIDLIAGHIPSAINEPFTNNLDEDGFFLKPLQLKKKYQTIFKNINPKNIIVHCGSGVTACHTLLAIYYAGLKIPKLYVGSWSEWSRNNKKIET